MEDTTDASVSVVEATDFSPIEVASLAGVRNQLVYNYIQAGRIEIYLNDENHYRIKRDVALAWVDRFKSSKAEREAKRAAKLAAQLEGRS
jgi:hypothetical protein